MVISRLLRKGASVLVASKVLVISRLLHNVLSQRPNPPPYVESLRNQLATLRRKLLSNIDRRLKHGDTTVEGLVEAMEAFSLATSSSAADVLKHFLHVRLQAMSSLLGAHGAGHKSAAKSLSLFICTLHDTRSVVPHKLADALARLRSSPLLKSPEVQDLIELNLSVHDRWICHQIQAFTPFLRHDDLRKAEAEKLLKQWAEVALSGFTDGLGTILGRIETPKAIVDLRRDCFEIWFSDHHHVMGVDSAKVLDSLREAFNARLVQLMGTEIRNLCNVGSTIKTALQHWQDGMFNFSFSLWDVSVASMDMSRGAGAFKSALISRSQGLTEPVQETLRVYSSWLRNIEAYESLIAQLRASRWEEDVDDLDDEDDLLDNKQTLLSGDDPRTLQDHLETALANAFASLQSDLQDYVTAITSDLPQQGPKAAFLLRILRSLRQQLPPSYHTPGFGLSLLPTFHATLSSTVLQTPLNNYTTRITKAIKRRRTPGRAVWQGEPELPIQPSPSTFRFLQELCNAMADAGSDVWSPAATGILKARVRAGLAEHFAGLRRSSEEEVKVNGNGHTDDSGVELDAEREEAAEDSAKEEAANGGAGKPESSAPKTNDDDDFDKHLLFDLFYILAATSTPTPTSAAASSQAQATNSSQNGSLSSTLSAFEERSHLPTGETVRLRKAAEEYWKRTSLLFALLA